MYNPRATNSLWWTWCLGYLIFCVSIMLLALQLGGLGRFMQILSRRVHDVQSHTLSLWQSPIVRLERSLCGWQVGRVLGAREQLWATQVRKLACTHRINAMRTCDRFVLPDHCRFFYLFFRITTWVLMIVKDIVH